MATTQVNQKQKIDRRSPRSPKSTLCYAYMLHY